jgi:hypothetical protein
VVINGRNAMHVVINGRRAGSVQMPGRVVPPINRQPEGVDGTDQHAATPSRKRHAHHRRSKEQVLSPSVTPVTSPAGDGKHQNMLLATETEGTPLYLLTHGDPALLRQEFLESSQPAVAPPPPPPSKAMRRRSSLPPSRLRSPARRDQVRNLADDLAVEDLDTPPLTQAGESAKTLQSRNEDLRKQLETAAAQLASRRQTLRTLAVATRTAKATAVLERAPEDGATVSVPGPAERKPKKTERARLRRSMLLARGLGTTRLELKQLREEVVSVQQQMVQETAAAVAQVSAAVANAEGSSGTVIASSSKMEQFIEMQQSVANMLRDIMTRPSFGLPLAAEQSAPSLSAAAVGEWLSSLGLAEHAPAFASHAVDGTALMELTDAQLREELRVLKVGHRNRISAARRQLLGGNQRGHHHHSHSVRRSGDRPSAPKQSNFFRPPRLELAASLTGGRRTPRSKLLSRANKAKLQSRLAATTGRPETSSQRSERQDRAMAMLLDLLGEAGVVPPAPTPSRNAADGDQSSDAGSTTGSRSSVASNDLATPDGVPNSSSPSASLWQQPESEHATRAHQRTPRIIVPEGENSVSWTWENDTDDVDIASSGYSEDGYSQDFDAVSLTTADTEFGDDDYDSSGSFFEPSPDDRSGSPSEWMFWGGVPTGYWHEEDAPPAEVAEEEQHEKQQKEEEDEEEAEEAYESDDFERLSSASGASSTRSDSGLIAEQRIGGSDSPVTAALKCDFLAGITAEQDSDDDQTEHQVLLEPDDGSARWWSASASDSAEMLETPRRGDNTCLTCLSTRSYSEEVQDEQGAIVIESVGLDADAVATKSFSLPSGEAVAVCADIFLQLQPGADLRAGSMSFVGGA